MKTDGKITKHQFRDQPPGSTQPAVLTVVARA